jgi:hypothetical protein
LSPRSSPPAIAAIFAALENQPELFAWSINHRCKQPAGRCLFVSSIKTTFSEKFRRSLTENCGPVFSQKVPGGALKKPPNHKRFRVFIFYFDFRKNFRAFSE